jgi:molybdopterin molybdotransferase
MLSVETALAKVLEQARPLPAVVAASTEALGRVLAEAIASDVDSPPHDKSIVDGYALRAADLEAGIKKFNVLEEVTAGQLPTLEVASGQATRIMTGAPIPSGADAVVMVERTELVESATGVSQIVVDVEQVKAGQNIMRQASSMRRGETVLLEGSVVRAIELGLLAEVGRSSVSVVSRPTVAVLATGDELVPAEQVPQPGQIRNSNGPMLVACARQLGAIASDLGFSSDDRAALAEHIERGLAADVLVLSGGVSAGVLDLVPGVLEELGVQQVFHKVNLKPGKPLWFGVGSRGDRQTLVFGLPGNPVSSLVCFELFVRPAIRRLAGHKRVSLTQACARLSEPFSQRGDRPTYYPSKLEEEGEQRQIMPLRWKGSGDLRTLADANALAYFPAGEREFAAGSRIDVLVLE